MLHKFIRHFVLFSLAYSSIAMYYQAHLCSGRLPGAHTVLFTFNLLVLLQFILLGLLYVYVILKRLKTKKWLVSKLMLVLLTTYVFGHYLLTGLLGVIFGACLLT